jgi:ABC-type polysaccharide/polyol phosphate export permease
MSLGMFVLLNHAGIFVVGITNVPYPIYAMLGVAFWQVFATGIQASSNTLVNAGSMIVKINCSKKSLVIAAIGQPMVSFIIQLIFIGALFVAYRLTPHLSVIFIPFLLLPIVALVLALGFILSLINGIVRDVGNALSALLGFLMLLTPVFYPKPSSGILAYISTLNPLFYLTSLPRDLVLSGTSTEWTGYIVSVCLSGVALVASILIFHLTETRIAERI